MHVEDDPDFREMLAYLLTGRGDEVVGFGEADSAKEYLLDESKALPELIVLDVMMPGTDGLTFSNFLQENARTRAVPIIVLTAKPGVEELFAHSTRVAAVLRKPVDINRLFTVIRGAIERSRQPRAPSGA